MNFEDSPKEAAFRAEARTWLEANVPTEGEMAGMDELQRAKLWQKRKADAGWACISWPKTYGGRGASAIERVILDQEEAKVNAPAHSRYFGIGYGMAAPTLMRWANEADKARFLPRIASGEEVWCQLFQ